MKDPAAVIAVNVLTRKAVTSVDKDQAVGTHRTKRVYLYSDSAIRHSTCLNSCVRVVACSVTDPFRWQMVLLDEC